MTSNIDKSIKLPVITEKKPSLTCDNDLKKPNRNTKKLYSKKKDTANHKNILDHR